MNFIKIHRKIKHHERICHAQDICSHTPSQGLGWLGGAIVLGKLPVPGRPTHLHYSRARAYCAYSRCRWGFFGHFFSRLSFLFSVSLSLGDGPIQTEILSQRAVKPKNNQQQQKSKSRSQSEVKGQVVSSQLLKNYRRSGSQSGFRGKIMSRT